MPSQRFPVVMLVVCVLLGSLLGTSPVLGETEKLISSGDLWRYYNQDHAPADQAGITWKEPGYDDSTWPSGPSQLGYGDGGEATVLGYGNNASAKWPSYYFRRTVGVADVTKYTGMIIRLVRDDGAVVYINGVEVWRANVPDGTLTFDTYLQTLDPSWPAVGGSDESTFFTYAFDPAGVLVDGDNVVAVEVHQVHATSSDISFDLELLGEFPDPLAPAVPLLVTPTDGATGVSLAPTLEVSVDDPDSTALTVDFWGRSVTSTEAPFEIVVLPDTQNYVNPNDGYTHLRIFEAQTQWIRDEILVNGRNIVFVTQAGDLTDSTDSSSDAAFVEQQWILADAAMDLLDGVVAYGVCPGNHDKPGSVPDFYNQYFAYTRFDPYVESWYGGHYPVTGNDNSYQLFSAGGVDFIFVHLQVYPDQGVYDWANTVLSAHRNRIAVLTMHQYLQTDGNRMPIGQSVWDNVVVPNNNVRLVLCGHNHGEAYRVDMEDGRQVYQVLADYQSYTNGGNGFLRIMRFAPAEGRVYVETYSPYVDQYETDGNSQFTLDFPMVSYSHIGGQSVAPGQSASVVWSNLSAQTEYEWFAEVTDETARTTMGPLWRFTTVQDIYAPTAPDPADGATEVDINPALAWTAAVGVVYHDVYLGAEGQDAVLVGADLTEPSCELAASLISATTYFWKVVEKDGSGATLAEGPFWTFQTAPAPGRATLISPGSPQWNVPADTTLNWTAGTGAEFHNVWFGADDSANVALVSEAQVQTTFDPVDPDNPGEGLLAYNRSYFWRIDEIGPGGTTPGEVWEFTTAEGPLPTKATDPIPAAGATDVPANVVLEWTAGTDPGDGDNPVTWHELYLWKAGDVRPSMYQNVGTETATTYNPGGLDYSTVYNWRVDETGAWGTTTGDVWSFTTQDPPPPEPAGSPIPTDQAVVDLNEIVLSWAAGIGATSHDVYFGTAAEFYGEPPAGDHDSSSFRGNQTETSYALGTLVHDQVYYWRIDEVNSGATTPGEVWTFTARDVTAPSFAPYSPQVPPDTLRHTSAVVKAETNEPTTALVEYALTETLDSAVSVFDGDLITYHDVLIPETGQLIPDTTYYYRVTVTDAYENAATSAVLSFTTKPNTPPLAGDDTASTIMGVAETIDVLGNDVDADGDALAISGVQQTTMNGGGVAIVSATEVRYTPAAGYFGEDTFTYTVTDGMSTDEATVTITVTAVDYDAYAVVGPLVRIGAITGTVDATTVADGVYQSIDESPNGPAAYSLDAEYLLHTEVDPAYVSGLTIHLVHTWTGPAEGDGLHIELLLVDGDILDITGDLADGQYQASDAGAMIDVDGNIRIRFTDTLNKKKEARDTLVIDLLYADIVVGPPDTTPPAAPQNLTATGGQAMVSLEWDDNLEWDFSDYIVYRSADNSDFGEIAVTTESAYVDGGLAENVTYYYIVIARDAAGNCSADSEITWATTTSDTTPPAAPSGVMATAGDGQVSLDWDDNPEADLAGYMVYRSDGDGYQLVATGLLESRYLDAGLINGTTYSYVVRAVDASGNPSADSESVSATPEAGATQSIAVGSIFVELVSAGRNWKGQATVTLDPPVANATITCNWYLDTDILATGQTAITDASGQAVIVSVPTKAVSGQRFIIEITDVALTGYEYAPGTDTGEISVP